MKTAIVLTILLAGCANGGWTLADTYRQAAMVTITTADWLQTRQIAQHPKEFCELNPILGKHPSTGEVDLYFMAAIATHTAVSMALPPGYRDYWQYFWIGAEVATVGWNLNLGLQIKF